MIPALTAFHHGVERSPPRRMADLTREIAVRPKITTLGSQIR
jgi:hypothetical protein